MSRAPATSIAVRSAALVLAFGGMLAAGPAFAEEGIQIVPSVGKLVPLIVLFLVMIVPVNRLILQPLLGVLEEREARIAGARARADEIARRADETLSSYESRIASARAEAEVERRGTLEEARGRHAARVSEERGAGESRIVEARAEIARTLEGARTQLEAQAQDLARQAAERMLGRSL